MYQVIWKKSFYDKGITIHESAGYGQKILSGTLEKSCEGLAISTFEFKVAINHPCFSNLKPFTQFIQVLNDGHEEFLGRIVKISSLMSAEGKVYQTVYCEDMKSVLHDTTQRYMKPKKLSVIEYLKYMLNAHNSQVEPYKRMELGKVDVIENDIVRGLGYITTAEAIKSKLLDRLGGYLELQGDTLSYVKNSGVISRTPLQITKNLRSSGSEDDFTQVFTRIVPVGKEIDDKNHEESGTDFSKPKHEISDVNGGKNYLQSDELIEEFGVIQKVVEFNDVSDHKILKTKGQNYLNAHLSVTGSWSVEAIELGLIDIRYEIIQVGHIYPIDNKLIAPEKIYLQVVKKTVDILNPQKVSLTIGKRKRSLSNYQQESKRYQKTVDDIKNSLINQEEKSKNYDVKINDIDQKSSQALIEIGVVKDVANDAIEKANLSNETSQVAKKQVDKVNDEVIKTNQMVNENYLEYLAKAKDLQKQIDELKKK